MVTKPKADKARANAHSDKAPDEGFPPIGAPALSALNHAGYYNLKQLTQVTEREIASLHGVGPKALNILRDTLHRQGLSFAQSE